MTDFFARHGHTFITVSTVVLAFAALVAILDQRLDAQDRHIDQRLDAHEKLINQRFDAQDRYINQRFDAVDQRFDAVDQRLDAQDKRMDNLEADMNRGFEATNRRLERLEMLITGIIERVSRNEGEIDVMREQLQGADNPALTD